MQGSISPLLEEVVVFVVITVLVALFAWIYLRDRQKSIGLWMLGWVAILIHFASPLFANFFPAVAKVNMWVKIATLIVAGSCFLLSVSKVFVRRNRRIAFVLFISTAATMYLTGLQLHYRAPWFYISLLLASTLFGVVQVFRSYNWRKPYVYFVCLLIPYSAWTIETAFHGQFVNGMRFYLCAFFYITGLVYFALLPQIYAGSDSYLCVLHPMGHCLSFGGICCCPWNRAWPTEFFLGPAKILCGLWHDHDAV